MKPDLTFAPLDYVIVFLFAGALLALGFSARLRNNSVLQFLAAGRQLSLPLFVASLVSMWYGGILGVGESASDFGLGTWVMFGLPYYVFALIYALFLAKRVRSADQLSIPERMQLRYGKPSALLAAFLIFLLAVPAAHVLMLGTLLQSLTGWTLTVCVLVGTAVGASFLFKGGLLADARASLLAFAMMYVGFAAMSIWCLSHYPLVATISSIPNKDLLKWDGGKGVLYVASLFIVGSWTLVDPGFHQRVTSSASPAIGKKGVLISTGFWFCFDVLSLTTAMYAIALNPATPGLRLFPSFAQSTLPPGLKAVFFCGMLGTIVSAMVGYSLVSGTTIGREVIARIRPGMADQSVTFWSRIGIALGCLVAIGLALSLESVVDLWTAWAGAVVGSMLIPVCWAYLAKRRQLPSKAVFLSMMFAFLVGLGWMFYGRLHGNSYLEIVFFHDLHGFRVQMQNYDAPQAVQNELAKGTDIAIGTLLPCLLVSAIVIAFGAGLRKRDLKDA